MDSELQTGRVLFDALRGRGTAARPPVCAPVDDLAARVAGTDHDTMTTDAASWAGAIARTTDLLGLDAVIVGFDFELTKTVVDLHGPERPAECGRLAVAIETAARLFQVARATKGCIAVMTGPITLAAQLFGEAAALARVGEVKSIQSAIAKAWCETRPDMLLFLERAPFAGAEIGNTERRAYNALRNITSYYDVAPVLWADGHAPGHLASLERLGMEFVVPLPAPAPAAAPVGTGLGIALPLEDAAAAVACARAWTGCGRAFLINDAPLRGNASIETLVDVIAALRQVWMN